MIQAINLIAKNSGYTIVEIAQFLNTDEKTVASWIDGTKIPNDQVAELSACFDLPERLFNKKLSYEEEIKIVLKLNANISFEDGTDDFNDEELESLNVAAEHGMLLLKDGLPNDLDGLVEELGYDSKEDLLYGIRETVRKHAIVKGFLDNTINDKDISFHNKFFVMHSLWKWVKLLNSYIESGEEIKQEDINQIFEVAERVLKADDSIKVE